MPLNWFPGLLHPLHTNLTHLSRAPWFTSSPRTQHIIIVCQVISKLLSWWLRPHVIQPQCNTLFLFLNPLHIAYALAKMFSHLSQLCPNLSRLHIFAVWFTLKALAPSLPVKIDSSLSTQAKRLPSPWSFSRMVQWRGLQNLNSGLTSYQSKPRQVTYLPWIVFSSTNENSELLGFCENQVLKCMWKYFEMATLRSIVSFFWISSSSEPHKNISTVSYCYNLYRVWSLSLTFKSLKWLVHICVPQPRIIGSHVCFLNKLMSEGMNPFLPSWTHFGYFTTL